MSRCYSPIEVSPKLPNFNGKPQKSDFNRITVPCGQCIGCRMNRAENWASRMMHEASLHANNSFITLTYNDHNLPHNGSLTPGHVTLFLKRLRKALNGKKILYYYCGEYGDHFSRPHYHIALFNQDFSDDRIPWRNTSSGFPVYRSPLLEKLWTHGNSEISNLDYDCARYVAGYIQKKVNGLKQQSHYEKLDSLTGELTHVLPEFARMSRRPAIGLKWIEKYTSDIYNYDVCLINQKKLRPPAYYDKILKKTDLQTYERVKMNRESSQLLPQLEQQPLVKTYEAKVLASQKVQRSLEGVPAHTPDRERLDYLLNRHNDYHYSLKENKNDNKCTTNSPHLRHP